MTVQPDPDPTAVDEPTPGPVPQDVQPEQGGPGVFASVDSTTVVGGADASTDPESDRPGDTVRVEGGGLAGDHDGANPGTDGDEGEPAPAPEGEDGERA